MNSSIHRALVFQGGGSLGAYEAGTYKDINEELSRYLKAEGRGNEPIFHIIAGTNQYFVIHLYWIWVDYVCATLQYRATFIVYPRMLH
jgi:hypothetical protein